VGGAVSNSPKPTTLQGSERALILRTLESVGWVIGGAKGAAAQLGVKRTTLLWKMKKLGISRPAPHNNVELREQLREIDSQPVR
jgi:formate hydrogenlyase transcriptional activator